MSEATDRVTPEEAQGWLKKIDLVEEVFPLTTAEIAVRDLARTVIAQAEELKRVKAELADRGKSMHVVPHKIVHIGWAHYRYEVTYPEPHLVIDMGPIADGPEADRD